MSDNNSYIKKKYPQAHLMLDIETLGTPTKGKFNVQILTIAMYPFGILAGKIEPFYIKLDPVEDSRFFTTQDTINWWSEQETAVKLESLSGDLTHEEGVDKFLKYYQRCLDIVSVINTQLSQDGKEMINPNVAIWGNGCEFDNIIVQSWIEICGREVPWTFNNNHSMRTAGIIRPNIKRCYPPQNQAHNALVDAAYQAKSVHKMLTGDELILEI